MTIRSILQHEKLTGSNFMNWYRNLRIVLRSEGKLAHLEQPLIPIPLLVAPQAVRDTYKVLYNAQNKVACLMLRTKQELFNTVKAFHACKQEDGQSVRAYILKMKGYLDTLERLGYVMPKELGSIVELHDMLKLYEKGAKGKDKGKNKLAYAPNPKISPPPKREHPTKDFVCYHYKEVGHWKRNCPSYQAELKKRKSASIASTSVPRKVLDKAGS
ncbi:zinc finger, CCHC-type containing protein [Tanacetum coccineum]